MNQGLNIQKQIEESYETVWDKIEGWLDTLIVNLPNLLIAILVFALSYVLSGFIRRKLQKLLKKVIETPSVRSLVATMTSVAVIIAGLLISLSVLNLDTILKSMLAGAGVAGLAIGLALQSSLANTFSGIYLSLRDIINIGDWVETNGFSGTVEEVNLRNTVIKEPDNNLVMVPNKLVVENPFKNFGLTDKIRVILECGVGYESDLEKVVEIAKSAIREHYPHDGEKDIEFHYLEFGDSSINFQLRFWVDAKAKLSILEARSKAIIVLKKAFDLNNINIPFPIRTIQMAKPDNEIKVNLDNV